MPDGAEDADGPRHLFFVRVKAAKSYAHNLVRISRQNAHGVWVTTRIIRLNAPS